MKDTKPIEYKIVFQYEKYDKDKYFLPYIGKIVSWEKNQDKPDLEFGKLYIDEVEGDITLSLEGIKEKDIIEIGQLPKGQKFPLAQKRRYQVLFSLKNFNGYTLQLISPNEDIRFLLNLQQVANTSWEIDTTKSIKKETSPFIDRRRMKNRGKEDSIWESQISQPIRDYEKIDQSDFSRNFTNASVPFSIRKELREYVQDLINLTGEIIATEKPCSEKLFKIFKKGKDIEKKKEVILIRSIEI